MSLFCSSYVSINVIKLSNYSLQLQNFLVKASTKHKTYHINSQFLFSLHFQSKYCDVLSSFLSKTIDFLVEVKRPLIKLKQKKICTQDLLVLFFPIFFLTNSLAFGFLRFKSFSFSYTIFVMLKFSLICLVLAADKEENKLKAKEKSWKNKSFYFAIWLWF